MDRAASTSCRLSSLLAHADSAGRVGTQPQGTMAAPMAGRRSVFIYVVALYLAAVEGRGHFCPYAVARPHRTLQTRG